ncbi:MAG: hypothetical protein JWL62_175 [Hyphomicrobiales bacterium]|nr:hypothetical protein [Hyphomicrobiales bacterium]
MTSYDLSLHKAPPPRYVIRHIRLSDLGDALTRGLQDFWVMPSHLLFLGLFYPIAGLILAVVTAGENAFYLLYPLLSGFVLIGPFAAIGLYEMSRRRERGERPSWRDAFAVLRSPGIGSILWLGALLAVLFIAWLVCAHMLYMSFFGDEPAKTYAQLGNQIFYTAEGRRLMIVGNLVGLIFAFVALSLSVFSFPLMLDRHVGIDIAIRTSLQATRENPGVILAWGVIVVVLLVAGMAAAFMGLALVMPVLAHATWHLYRRTVGPPLT